MPASRRVVSRSARRHSAMFECLESRRLLSVAPVVIDVLAVYTPAAAAQNGGDAHLVSLIQSSIDAMNQALVNSDISITARLVHVEPVNYSGSDNLSLDRQRLETPGDGYMDNVQALRDQYGADLVTLITDGPTVGGGNGDLLAHLNDPKNSTYAYSAIAANSVGPGNLTLAHELGHNLGGGHERGNPTQPAVGPFSYSYGYRYSVTTDGQTASYNDVMGYSYGTDVPIPYYANPAVSFGGAPTGKPTGDPAAADIASTFLQTGPIVAGYRSTLVSDTTAPTAVLVEVIRSGSSLDFTVRYTDDSAIDLSSLGGGDVSVSGPGGFVLPATLVATDHPAVAGAFKQATYHVTLPAANPPTRALSFNLLPSAVADLSGHFAPAQLLSPAQIQNAAYGYASAPDLGTLATGSTRTEFGAVSADYRDDVRRFTLASPATLSVSLTGLSGDANVLIAQDTNGNAMLENDEVIEQGGQTGTADEGIAVNLAPGTYYVWVYQISPTPYTLSLNAYVDTAPPTATLDSRDITVSGTPFIDFAVTYADDNDVDGVSARFWAALDIHAVLDNGGSANFYYYPDPDLNSSYANASSRTIYYRIDPFNPNTGFTAAENGTYTVSIHPNQNADLRVHDAAGNDIPLLTLGSFRVAVGKPDATPPAATLTAAPPVPGQGAWEFSVAYADGRGINAASIDSSDIRVTGPHGFNQLASRIDVTPATTIGGVSMARYQIPAPGGLWDGSDDGAYTFALEGGQVLDASGNSAAPKTLGTVSSTIAGILQQGDGVVAFAGTSAADTLSFDADDNFVYFNLNGSNLWLLPRGAAGSISFSSITAGDQILFQRGAHTIAADAGGSGTAPAITVEAGAALTFAATQHLTALTVNGSATVAPGRASPLVLSALALSPAASLDLADNSLVLRYAGASPESQVQQYVKDALTSKNAHGLFASQASDPTFSQSGRVLAAFDNHDAHFTAFAGQALSNDWNQVLVKYTYLGDANADGKVDPTDYAIVDGLQGLGDSWITGDLNFDGKTTPDDYAQIDGNQGAGYGNAGGPQLSSLPFLSAALPAIESTHPDPLLTDPPSPLGVSRPLATAPSPSSSPFSRTPLSDDLLGISPNRVF